MLYLVLKFEMNWDYFSQKRMDDMYTDPLDACHSTKSKVYLLKNYVIYQDIIIYVNKHANIETAHKNLHTFCVRYSCYRLTPLIIQTNYSNIHICHLLQPIFQMVLISKAIKRLWCKWKQTPECTWNLYRWIITTFPPGNWDITK